jgi:hypothetical protein
LRRGRRRRRDPGLGGYGAGGSRSLSSCNGVSWRSVPRSVCKGRIVVEGRASIGCRGRAWTVHWPCRVGRRQDVHPNPTPRVCVVSRIQRQGLPDHPSCVRVPRSSDALIAVVMVTLGGRRRGRRGLEVAHGPVRTAGNLYRRSSIYRSSPIQNSASSLRPRDRAGVRRRS